MTIDPANNGVESSLENSWSWNTFPLLSFNKTIFVYNIEDHAGTVMYHRTVSAILTINILDIQLICMACAEQSGVTSLPLVNALGGRHAIQCHCAATGWCVGWQVPLCCCWSSRWVAGTQSGATACYWSMRWVAGKQSGATLLLLVDALGGRHAIRCHCLLLVDALGGRHAIRCHSVATGRSVGWQPLIHTLWICEYSESTVIGFTSDTHSWNSTQTNENPTLMSGSR